MHTCNPSSQDSETGRLEAQVISAYIADSRKNKYPHHWHYFTNNVCNNFKTMMLKEAFTWLEKWNDWNDSSMVSLMLCIFLKIYIEIKWKQWDKFHVQSGRNVFKDTV